MGLNSRSGIGVLALVAGMAASSYEPVLMQGFAVGSGDGSLSVGAVRTSLFAAMAQSADTFSLEDVSITSGSVGFKIKRVDFKGVTTARAEIEALFDPGSTVPLADRLARIDARQVVIPEIVVEQTMAGWLQTTVYRNVTADTVQQGHVATMTAETSAQELTAPHGKTTVTQGRGTVQDLDLAALARVYVGRAGPNPGPLTKIYANFTVADLVVTDPAGGSFRIATLGASDFRARPTADSWSGTISLFTSLSEMGKLSPADESRLITAVTDVIDSMDFGSIEAVGIDTANLVGPDRKSATSRVERITFRSARDGGPSEAVLQGLKVGTPDGGVTIDSVSVTGFSIRPTLDGLRALQGRSIKDLPSEELRSLLPVFGTTKLSGLSVDLPNSADKSPTPGRVKASVKSVELTSDKPVDGIPSRFRFGLSNLAVSLPAESDDESIKTLIDWGYRDIDVSFLASAEWNAGANAIEVRDLSFQGKDMGNVSLHGTIGNVSRDVFDPDSAVAIVSLMASTIKDLDVTVENKGLFDRYLTKAAQSQRTKPETLRKTYGTAAAFLIPSMIGSSDQAKAISKAVSRFISKPGRINLHAVAKDPSGIVITDLFGSEPDAILKRVDVTATND